MNAYQAYNIYIALRAHFNSLNYDYFKYGGRVRISLERFEKRSDKYFFQKLSRVYTDRELRDYVVANMLQDSNMWIGDMVSDQGKTNFIEWQKRVQAFDYIFTDNVRYLAEFCKNNCSISNFDDLFSVSNGSWPHILQCFLSNNITIETFIVTNRILNFIPQFDRQIKETIIWPSIKHKCLKYEPFFRVDLSTCRRLMKEILLDPDNSRAIVVRKNKIYHQAEKY